MNIFTCEDKKIIIQLILTSELFLKKYFFINSDCKEDMSGWIENLIWIQVRREKISTYIYGTQKFNLLMVWKCPRVHASRALRMLYEYNSNKYMHI